MKGRWNQKLCAVATVSMLLSSAPVGVLAQENARITQSDPEEVYVDIIGDGQRTTLFNENWKFHRGDINDAQNKDYNDSTWETVNLPHDYSIDQDFTTSGEAESGFLPGGVGWYRKTFVVPKKYQEKQLMIEFDGAYMNAEVYLNGTKLGEHPYGYTAFAFDLTEGLICDGETENVLVVKTNNKIPSSRWYSGSGIYRDVKLTVTDKVHVGYNGTKIIAKDLENTKDNNVKVDVTATIDNDSDTNKTITVKNTLLDAQGNAAGSTVTNEVELAAKSTKDVKQEVSVIAPKLWSTEDTNLYTMKTEIVADNKVLDTYETEYGFRYFDFDNNTGFSLNGEKIKLKGVCLHHDQGALGAVANRDAIERQVKILKEMGCNAIRVTHNPAASVLLEVCNENGMLVINEAFDGWTEYKNGNVNDYTSHFNEVISTDNQIVNGKAGMKWGEFDVKAMVDGAKNDPSVIMWSLGNEIDEGVSGNTSHYLNLVDDLIKWVQEVDTTRPVTNGDNRKNTNPNAMLSQINQKIYEAGGVVGINYANGDQTIAMHNTYSDWPLYGSETASAVHSRGVYNTTGKDDNTLQMSEYDNDEAKVGWGHSASDAWQFVIKNDFNAGEFVWTGFDYIGEPTPWNGTGAGSASGQGAKPKSSYFGIVDTAGFVKDTYYLYKSMWDEDTTTLHLMSTWNNDEIVKNNNGKVKVDVFTNAAKVELYLNGNKVGEDTATTHTTALGYKYQTFSNGEFYPSFNVTWASGTLSAKAYDKKGNLITETEGRSSVTTNTKAAKLAISADKKEILADGSSLSYLTVDVKDMNGNIVAGADNRINFKIEGNGKIVGVDNGNAADTDSYKGTSRKAFSGKALVIVQSTKDEGSFTLSASSDGLSGSNISVKTVKNAVEGDAYLQSYTIAKNLYVNVGEEPDLPAKVVGTYNNGETRDLTIKWNEYDKESLNKIGEFTITGKLQDSEAVVTVTVHVIGNVVAMENYSTVTSAGITPVLPQTVRGLYENGNYSEAFPVKWNIPADAFKNEGVVTVKGTVNVLNEVKDVTATVRVAPKLADSQNIASKNYQDTPLFTNGKMVNGVPSEPTATPINDSLSELNDGITNESGRESARWTNWSLRNENPPVDTYVQLEWQKEYLMQNIKLWHFTDNQFSVLPGDNNVRFEYYDVPTNSWQEIESSHITQVPYTSGDTPYGFIHPITTNKLRIWMKSPQVNKCIGLTEIEVYDYILPVTANSSANLDDLKLDGVNIKEFNGYRGYDKLTKTYTVDLKTADTPSVIAQGNNNEAITVLPVYNNEVKIIVRAEDGKTIENYTIKYIISVNKEFLENYIESDEIKKVFETSEEYTVQSYQEFKEAYDQAIVILKDDQATQKQVDDSYEKLQTMYQALVKKTEEKVDKSQLEALLAIADKITEDILSNLDADLVNEFKTALQAAQDIYTGNDVTQAQVNAAITRLNVAIENLNIRDFNKIKLQELVERTEKLSAKDYTRASWERLEKALSAAKIVLADEKATLAAVDEAKTVLQNALEQLEKVAISEESSQGVKTGDAANFAGIFALMVSTASLVLWMKRRKENN